jgi:hypothetical protein
MGGVCHSCLKLPSAGFVDAGGQAGSLSGERGRLGQGQRTGAGAAGRALPAEAWGRRALVGGRRALGGGQQVAVVSAVGKGKRVRAPGVTV